MKKYFPPPRQFSALAYLCVCLNAVVLKYYELTDEPTFIRLIVEDSLIEDLTAVLLSLAGILLFVTGRMERKAFRRWIYVLGGILALFIAGEEISWGQRIFGYPTPDWIAEKNSQNEFNLHNLHFFQNSSMHGFRYGVQLLCMMACMAFLTGRERIRGVPVPSILLTLGLLAILSYDYDFYRSDFPIFTLRTLSEAPNTLICLIIIFTLFCRQYELLIFSAAAILLSLTLAVVNHLCGSLTAVGFSKREGVEYLITLAIFCYSSELFLNQKLFLQADHLVRRSTPDQGRASIGLFFRRLVHPVGRRLSCVPDPHPPGNSSRPFWLAIPALSISISIGLMSSAYVTFWSRETYATELAQEIASRKPIIRSHFDVYLSQNRIIYKKENCSRHDISRSFFLYVIRTNLHQSFIARRFTFSEYGTSLYRNASYWDKARNRGERSCFLVYPLSMWGTVSIWTGQESLWEAATLVDQHADGGGGPADRFERDADRSITRAHRRIYDAVVSREPRVRSAFNLYLYDRTLIFVKEPCLRSDVEAAFFLHVEPVDNASLPLYRRRLRLDFDSLDFRFSKFGTVFDDKCIAVVPVPAYDISRIVTGQYTSEKRLWQVEIPFHNK